MERCDTHRRTSDICRKWYERLGFPTKYDGEFEKLLGEYDIPDTLTIEGYDSSEPDGKRNLLSMLFMCEKVEERYREKRIPEDVMIDTLRDLVIWTEVWSGVKGGLCLFEIPWLARHVAVTPFLIYILP